MSLSTPSAAPVDLEPAERSTDVGYRRALAFLYPRTASIKFGLDTTRALLEVVGRPDLVFPVIHVGGTNGKGSVSALVAAALRESGWRVGLYTSPHLCSFRERIVVDGIPISEGAVAMWTARLEADIQELGATFFEVTTVMALADFAARGVEVAVLEVGLGGRLDSTNVVTPLVSGVTTVALDHMKYLGDSIADIAREKAGIAKAGVPFIIGEEAPEIGGLLGREATIAVAAQGGGAAEIRPVPPDVRWEGRLALAGPHQRRNAAVAEAFLAALPERFRPAEGAVTRAFAQTTVPGRYDRRGKWLFDVAHNPAGMASLLTALEAEPPPRPLHALVSILGDKPWAEMLVALDRAVDVGILTMASTAANRGWDASWLHEWLADSARPPATAHWRLIPDFRAALDTVQDGAQTVLVTGSFHTVGDVMAELGLAPI